MTTDPKPDPKPDPKAYYQNAKNEINKWENEGPGWLTNVGNFILKPAQRLAESIIPPGVQESVSKAIESSIVTISKASSGTVTAEETKKKIEETLAGGTKSALEASDDEARKIWNWHLGYAATEGGVTGAAGLLGMAADVPALFSIVIRLIQQIGTCYGYDITKPNEQDYVLHILRVASATDVNGKLQALLVIKNLEGLLLQVTWKVIGQDLAAKTLGQIGIRELSKNLGVNLTQRKALQSVPIIGALVGASFNASFANDVGRAAYMSYRRRWIAEQEMGPIVPK